MVVCYSSPNTLRHNLSANPWLGGLVSNNMPQTRNWQISRFGFRERTDMQWPLGLATGPYLGY